MKFFKPNLPIQPLVNPMGFIYGPNCFGPKVENRTLDAIRPSLLDSQCAGPEIVYSIAMDVGKNKHREELQQTHLLQLQQLQRYYNQYNCRLDKLLYHQL